LAGPSCCRKLKIRQENIGFTEMQRQYLDFRTAGEEEEKEAMEKRLVRAN
jgi:hypothetical protein